jgi:BirA family transcriptional regulator, biotin operon repressor / biotin---[acetyl-CoA-carboxylase] ligase
LPEGGQHVTGTFLGVDENFGMLLKTPDGATRLIPLETLIEKA